MQQAKQVIGTMVVQGLDLLAGVAASILVARVLGPEALGRFGLAFGIAGFSSIFLLYGTGDVAISWHIEAKATTERILGASLRVWAGGSLWVVALGILASVVLRVDAATACAIAFALGALIVNGVASTLNHPILAHGLSGTDVPNAVLAKLTLVGGVVIGGVYGSLPGVLCSYIASAVVLSLLRWRMLRQRLHVGRPQLDMNLFRQLRKRGRAVGRASIFGTISSRSDLLLLKLLSTTADVGLFAAASRVTKAANALATACAVALFPGFVRARAVGRTSPAYWLFFATPAALACLLLGTSLWSGELVLFLYGPSFEAVTPIMRLLLWAAAFQMLTVFANKLLVARAEERVLLPVQAAGAILDTALNVALIGPFRGVGVAMATLISDGVVATTLVNVVLLRERTSWRSR